MPDTQDETVPGPTTAFRSEVTAARDALLGQARRLESDEHDAQRLVNRVMEQAMADAALAPAEGGLSIWLSGLMRNAFHSVERRRVSRRGASPRGEWDAAKAAAYANTPRSSE